MVMPLTEEQQPITWPMKLVTMGSPGKLFNSFQRPLYQIVSGNTLILAPHQTTSFIVCVKPYHQLFQSVKLYFQQASKLSHWPGLPEGHFGVTSGPMMASSNSFEIMITGKGGHAALPHNSADPVLTGVQIAQALQSIITRNKRPIDAAVLSITQFHAGETSNVIPESAFIGGTVRTFTLEVLDLIESRLRELSHNIASAFECQAEIKFSRNYPPLINHDAEVQFATEVMRDLVGDKNVDNRIDPTMGAEDFAFMLLQKPGCYVFLGNGDGDHRSVGHGMGPCHLHNPSYDFNDALIPVGVNYWVNLAQRFLEKS